VRIGLIQRSLVVGDLDGNVERLLDGARAAAGDGARLAVTTEMAITGYPPHDLLERPDFIDANLRALDDFARRCPIPAIVGFADRTGRTVGRPLYNAAALVADGAVRSVHHKSLLPTYDVFDEARYFEPAETLQLAELDGKKLGIAICEDIWNDADFWPQRRYPRDPVTELADLGADIIINIAASPFAVHKRPVRGRMLAAQARKHGLPVVSVNQLGANDDLLFDGASAVFDSRGRHAAQAPEFAEDILCVDVEPRGAARGPMRSLAPFDDAGDQSAALAALTFGVREYAHKCGFSSALVGLSGGIDSALTAAIAARALGANNVVGVALPSRYSSDHSVRDAQTLADNLGLRWLEVGIEPLFAASLAALEPVIDGETGSEASDITEQNLQARARGTLLMALSNQFGHLLLTTGNKSELAVGYCTLYGDMAGGLAVLSDVSKTLVYALARRFNAEEKAEIIPRSTLSKPPSAELAPNQVDQDSLPPYDVLDPLLELYVEGHLGRDELVARGFDAELTDRVLGLVQRSEYKRRQAAPGLKITSKAFGLGRRMPLAARWRS